MDSIVIPLWNEYASASIVASRTLIVYAVSILSEWLLRHCCICFSIFAGENFKNSQFLVFINRVLALAIGWIVLQLIRQPRHTGPLYKYSYCSFSNVMSSWFQYEALKFVSFPTQVLCKASKVLYPTANIILPRRRQPITVFPRHRQRITLFSHCWQPITLFSRCWQPITVFSHCRQPITVLSLLAANRC